MKRISVPEEGIETFFGSYKMLEGDQRAVHLGGWRGAKTAWALIEKSRKARRAASPEGRA